MARRVLVFAVFVGMLLLPLAGALLVQPYPLAHYFHFPPEIIRTYPRASAPGALLISILPAAFTMWLLLPSGFGFRRTNVRPRLRHASFPWWGYLGLVLCCAFWVLSWAAIPGVESVRAHAFSPLWLGYVLTVDGLVFHRKGHSLASRNLARFVSMFPVSAVLWWLFEYINRFVQNWYYVGLTGRTPIEYVLYATPAFATVLPALLETAELIGTARWLHLHFARGPACKTAPRAAWILAAAGALGLLCMGWSPTWLFPFAWLGPMWVLAPIIHRARPERSVLTDLTRGDYRSLVALSLCGPVCGVFWEMWNYFSSPKWEYQVPLVMFAKVFEMPALGYYGYVPFGWECLLIWNVWVVVAGVEGNTLELIPPRLQTLHVPTERGHNRERLVRAG